jgi:transketolase
MQDPSTADLARIAAEIRLSIIDAVFGAQTGHAGPSLSLVELLVFLYFAHAICDPRRPLAEDRDRVILSKGHASPVLYAVLARAGYFPQSWMGSLRAHRSALQGHPKAGLLPGIEASTGSLGQGLSLALGIALGLRFRQSAARTFCIVGDGELQEGQNWEAMMAASAFAVRGLTAIVDRNGLQNDGPTEEVMPLGDLAAKAQAFGWTCITVDGHDFGDIRRAFLRADEADTPVLIVANTIKGKGVSFMEGSVKWHHHPLSPEEHAVARMELGGGQP